MEIDRAQNLHPGESVGAGLKFERLALSYLSGGAREGFTRRLDSDVHLLLGLEEWDMRVGPESLGRTRT